MSVLFLKKLVSVFAILASPVLKREGEVRLLLLPVAEDMCLRYFSKSEIIMIYWVDETFSCVAVI